MPLFSWLRRNNLGSCPRNQQHLSFTALEGRDVPAGWYTVHLDSPPAGIPGNTVSTLAGGGLSVNPDYDPDGDGTALLYADSAADAVRTALTGTISVNLSAVSRPQTDYAFAFPNTATTSADQTPFLVTSVSGEAWKVELEDLAGHEDICDWDYDDYSWDVTVEEEQIVVSDPPTANPDRAVTGVDGPVTISPIANDTSVHGYYFEITQAGSDAEHGTVTIAEDGQTLVYTPDEGFFGTDSFSYTVTNTLDESATSTVTVVVYPDPVVTASGPGASITPNSTDPYTSIPFTLTRGGGMWDWTEVRYRVRVSDGPGYGNTVSQEEFTAFFAPDDTTQDLAFTLESPTAEQRVTVEVLPAIGSVPGYVIDVANSIFLCQVQAKPPVKAYTIEYDPDSSIATNTAVPYKVTY
jgi:Bacterial Ig domain